MSTLSLTAAANVAAQSIGALDSGEALSTQQYSDALVLGNNIWDNWSSDPKKILFLSRQVFALSQGQNTYSPFFTRPMAVVSASFLNSSGPGGPLRVTNADAWSRIPDRQRQSFILEALFYDRGTPTGTCYISPVPQGGNLSCEAWIWAALTQFPDTVTPITILPGYARLFIAQLALDMAPEYSVAQSYIDKVTANYEKAAAIVEGLNATLFASLSPDQRAAIQAAQ